MVAKQPVTLGDRPNISGLAIENCDIHELTRIIAKHENIAWKRNRRRARCLRSIIRIPKAWEKPLIKYLVVLVHLIIFHSFHLIFIAFEKLKPIPGISNKKKKQEGKDGHPQPLALSKLSTITIGGIRAMTP